VNVKTKKNILSVSAKHETKDGDTTIAMYELHRELAIPDGVKANEIVCEYTHEGVLQLTAPYTLPKGAAVDNAATPVKVQTIQVRVLRHRYVFVTLL
jgi:HSP20 family molecular chaperone IbpA